MSSRHPQTAKRLREKKSLLISFRFKSDEGADVSFNMQMLCSWYQLAIWKYNQTIHELYEFAM